MRNATARPTMRLAAWLVCYALISGVACDRNVEAFDPNEQPEAPDLSKIFPEGAERAGPTQPGMPAVPSPAGGRGAPPVAASSANPVRGTIVVDEGLEDRVPETSVLFVIARISDAGPPLAVKRIANPRFPLDFTLGPDDRMIQSMPFVGPLQISARLDGDGNASSRTPGDLQGRAPGTYEPGAERVSVLLNELL